MEAVKEFAQQCRPLGIPVSTIVHASSSGGTQAGLVVGCLAEELPTRVVGISADEKKDDLTRMVADIAQALAEQSGLPAPRKDLIEVLDDYVGEGYGVPTAAAEEATRLFARLEGILLDSTYTAKAAAGLINLIRLGRFKSDETVCFWHTGGNLALA